ncbi:MAG: hypothetical protein KIT84_04230 [Labilithrix sp.]|nr:hypothetical protein [Labilithrix sp.]MCW5810194.1 hypothetical protein [Labilithrix sp.]
MTKLRVLARGVGVGIAAAFLIGGAVGAVVFLRGLAATSAGDGAAEKARILANAISEGLNCSLTTCALAHLVTIPLGVLWSRRRV